MKKQVVKTTVNPQPRKTNCITGREMLNKGMAIVTILRFKGNGYDLNHALKKLHRLIEKPIEELQDDVKLINEEIGELKAEYCEKDPEGKPVTFLVPSGEVDKDGNIMSTESYRGLTRGIHPEYDARIKKLRDKLNSLLKKEYTIDFGDLIPKGYCKKLFENPDFDGILQGELESHILDA